MGEVIPSIMVKVPMRQVDQTGPRADAKQPAGEFAAQLREQLSVRRNPGPGSDAGKGGAAGDSAAQPTDARPRDEQGQTAGSGRETGDERLALQALLAGAQMTAATAFAAPDATGAGAAGTAGATEAAAELTAVTAASAEPAASAAAAPAARAASANAAQPATPAEPASGKVAGSAGATPAVPATPSAKAAAAAFAAQSRTTTAPAEPGDAQTQPTQQPAPATTTANTASTDTMVTASAATAPAATAATAESAAPADAAAAEAAIGAGTAAQTAPAAQTTEAVKTGSDDGSAVGKAARGKADRLASVDETDTAPADETTTTPATSSNPAVTKARSNSAPEQPTRTRAAATKAAADGDKPNSSRTDDASDALSVRPAAVTAGETAPVTTTRTIGVGRNPVDPTMAKSVIDQIVAKASVNREGELTELSLQLHPETLGRVNLRLSMAGGVLSAKVMVDNPAVKAALEANLADLRQSLADQGIALQGMSVALGGQGQQHEYRDYREAANQAAEAPGRIRSAAVRQNPVATPVRSRGAGHRLDLIV